MSPRCSFRCALVAVLCLAAARTPAGTFRVATYNIESYLDAPTRARPAKSAAAKAKVRECILALQPDVLALEEMGSLSALDELRLALKDAGLDLPHWEHVAGHDPDIHVAILSRFPFSARRSHTNEDFLLGGRRYHVSRGFAEVVVQVNPHCSFTLLAAHLKSRRASAQGDEAELRLEEAKRFRERIDACLAADHNLNLVALGDFNDTPDSPPLKTVIGRGKLKLIDTRPAEPNGDDAPSDNPAWPPRKITWTHHFGKDDTYARIDYLLLSPAMARHWLTNQTYILTAPNWGLASDHRPILATFQTPD